MKQIRNLRDGERAVPIEDIIDSADNRRVYLSGFVVVRFDSLPDLFHFWIFEVYLVCSLYLMSADVELPAQNRQIRAGHIVFFHLK